MNTNLLTGKSVEFKFGTYLEEGVSLFKEHMGTFILASFIILLTSVIPVVNFMVLGNFMKMCRALKQGENVSLGSLFSFDNFVPYLKFFLAIFAVVLLIEFPLIFSSIGFSSETSERSFFGGLVFIIMLILVVVLLFYLVVKSYYMISLLSLENVTSVREAWKISKEMTKNNFILILGFSFLVSIISSLGFLFCGIGVFLSLPLAYVMHYFSYEDGIQQLKTTPEN
ncbi:hypothetical protein [Riemerella anatipestifer]|uniref:Uncharacterized protein n=1 Tax=Riemerella anatipestifer TaxID=34085 RepID=A0A1S7DSR4_RIEAN|nr:hypothetical protein [Riemerella anatipestifer]AQY22159.1 hypothetical protein AB406_1211 [Riemerella anatipestifer]MBO4233519.1 hypothetical protein [Riemerella anatipestifer]MCO4303887.1 hypothetical protein [Riemerella anatipestifer]MCO7352752.1 hypothetical protein [Riemerella anatipestifer]MCQ4039365.1 hypothetical protein [Riemerella anatipestifer]